MLGVRVEPDDRNANTSAAAATASSGTAARSAQRVVAVTLPSYWDAVAGLADEIADEPGLAAQSIA